MTQSNEFPVDFRETRYKGYKSYSYLKGGSDYDEFELAPELGRMPLYDLGLDAAQHERTRSLVDDNIIISLHDHPQVFPEDMTQVRELHPARAASTPATRAWPARA